MKGRVPTSLPHFPPCYAHPVVCSNTTWGELIKRLTPREVGQNSITHHCVRYHYWRPAQRDTGPGHAAEGHNNGDEGRREPAGPLPMTWHIRSRQARKVPRRLPADAADPAWGGFVSAPGRQLSTDAVCPGVCPAIAASRSHSGAGCSSEAWTAGSHAGRPGESQQHPQPSARWKRPPTCLKDTAQLTAGPHLNPQEAGSRRKLTTADPAIGRKPRGTRRALKAYTH